MRLRFVLAGALVLAACRGPAPPSAPPTGATLYTNYCVACHQKDGSGREGLRPALAGSPLVGGAVDALLDWVMYQERADRPALPRYPAVMPPYAGLRDEDLALTLTYVRGAFGNSAGPVTAADVGRARARHAAHAR